MTPGQAPSAILSVRHLSVGFGDGASSTIAVDGLSYDLEANRTLAIVGESGSGKSVSALALLGLVHYLGGRIRTGRIVFRSEVLGGEIDLVEADDTALRSIRGNELAMIFQEPMTSLNPVFTIGSQIVETITLHRQVSAREAWRMALDLMDLVRLPNAARTLNSYPHQLSGGMRQRAMIAMALSCRPKVLIADEPTTALDVTIQAQILTIIRDLQHSLETAVIFISHDMGVVAEMADDVLVMRNGRRVEFGPVAQIFSAPKADYTKSLLNAVPRIGSMRGRPGPMRFDHVANGAGPGPAKSNAVHPEPDRTKPLLAIEALTTRYDFRGGLFHRITHRVHAAENVTFSIYPGETLALVGESGSGKSTVGRTIQQLVKPVSGTVRFKGNDIFTLPPAARRQCQRAIQYVFQDPYGSLNPRKTAGASIIEPAATHGLIEGRAAGRKRVAELLERVGLEPGFAERYPHEFSGGQRQRICIARALASEPSLIIADEAVSALDVSVQAQVLNLLMDLQAGTGLAYLFITHDMAVVERVGHRVAVMYLGQIVELGTRLQIFETPQHPYTKRLLAAVPIADPAHRPERPVLDAEIPSSVRRVGDEPALHEFRVVAPGHLVAASSPDAEYVRN